MISDSAPPGGPQPVRESLDFVSNSAHDPAPIPTPAPWSPLKRVLFRIAFLYFFCFCFLYGNGTIFMIFPVVGMWLSRWLKWPLNTLAQWVGQHVFHLTGLAAHWHPTGSGDTTMNYILNGLFFVVAVAGGLLWTLAAALRGNRRQQYRTLHGWLRFALRLTCAFFMIEYGMAKVYPMQMAPISIAILNEPVGNMSPMTMLWALIGLNPVYEMIGGAAEVIGGVLLLFRRTALAGALFSSFVIANVLLYNMFFDVPVKLFAANLLLGLLYLALADAGPMWKFFIRHEPAAPVGEWFPPMRRKRGRIAIRVVEIVFMVGFLVALPILEGIGYFHYRKAAAVSTPLLGAWRLEADHPASGAFITPEKKPATDLYIDTAVRAFMRSTDGALWRTNLHLDPKTHTVRVRCYVNPPVNYMWTMPDANHLTLTSVPPEKPKADGKKDGKGKKTEKPPPPFTPAVLTFTRIPLPAHYPLLQRGFHFVNQWGLER